MSYSRQCINTFSKLLPVNSVIITLLITSCLIVTNEIWDSDTEIADIKIL